MVQFNSINRSMKRLLSATFLLLAILVAGHAQIIPKGMNYQAVARNLKGEVIPSQKITLKVFLFGYEGQQRADYYSEIHEVVTAPSGFFTLSIGEGVREQGAFGLIPWNDINIWMEVKIKERGQTGFATVSNNKLLAVPYAIHAGTASSLTEKTISQTSAFAPPGVESLFWSVLGNFNTNQSGNLYHTNSMGTTDLVDLFLITDNVERLRILKGGDIVTKLNFEVGKNLNVGLNLGVPLNATIGDSLIAKKNVLLNTTTGSTLNHGSFTVESMSPTLLSGRLTVNLETDLNSTLEVHGPTDLNDSLTVNLMSPVKFTGTLQVDSVTDLNDALFVNEMAPTSLTGTLEVDKDAIFNEKLKIVSMHQTDTSGAMPTGSLQVGGGTYIKENLYIGGIAKFGGPAVFGGAVSIQDLTQSTSTSTGALKVSGGVGIGLNLNVGGAAMIGGMTTIKDTTESIGITTGALKVMGGVGIRKNLNVTGTGSFSNNLQVAGAAIMDSLLNVNSSNAFVANFTNTGNQNGISIRVNNSAPGNANNFVEFRNSSGSAGVVGRIEGENVNEYMNNETYKREIDKLEASILAAVIAEAIAVGSLAVAIYYLGATIGSVTGCYGLGVMTCAPIISFIVKAILDVATYTVGVIAATDAIIVTVLRRSDYIDYKQARVGVTYESGSGDYAEWLPKADPSEVFLPGHIVGMKNGKISKHLVGSDRLMVISTQPIVLGNMPEKDKELNFEKVAFLGQVPVHVLGKVEAGDYIVPSGNNDGLGRAISPADLKTEDYARIVGTAWSPSSNHIYDLVNVAIGLNGSDINKVVIGQKNKIRELKEKFNKRNLIVANLVPGYREAMSPAQFQIENEVVPVIKPASSGGGPATNMSSFDFSQFEIKSEQLSDLLDKAEKLAAGKGVDLNSSDLWKRMKSDPQYKTMILNEAQKRIKTEMAKQFEKLRPRE